MRGRIQIDIRACFIDAETGDIVETSKPDSTRKPDVFGVYARAVGGSENWVCIADFDTHKYLELFINALTLKHHDNGSGFDLDLRHIAQFVHC